MTIAEQMTKLMAISTALDDLFEQGATLEQAMDQIITEMENPPTFSTQAQFDVWKRVQENRVLDILNGQKAISAKVEVLRMESDLMAKEIR